MNAPAHAIQTARHAENAPTGFETAELSFKVGETVLLHPLDLAFPAGEMVGLVGHNGSGKSTLLKLLARQERPSVGSVLLDGTDIQSWSSRAFARAVAYLPQEATSGLGLTVTELVAHGRYPWHGALGRFGEEDRAEVEEAMRLTDLAAVAGRQVDTLSGGERQRVWIAMLVAQQSRCLLLDEPTSALDIAHQIEILSLIRSLSHERGLGVVIVMHDINMAARFCDRIIALKAGRLIAEGRPDELMDPVTLERIYGVGMAVLPHPTLGLPVSYVL